METSAFNSKRTSVPSRPHRQESEDWSQDETDHFGCPPAQRHGKNALAAEIGIPVAIHFEGPQRWNFMNVH